MIHHVIGFFYFLNNNHIALADFIVGLSTFSCVLYLWCTINKCVYAIYIYSHGQIRVDTLLFYYIINKSFFTLLAITMM